MDVNESEYAAIVITRVGCMFFYNQNEHEFVV